MKSSKQEKEPPTKISSYVFWFVVGCIAINWGVKLLLEIWWVLAIIIGLVVIITILLRLKRWQDWS